MVLSFCSFICKFCWFGQQKKYTEGGNLQFGFLPCKVILGSLFQKQKNNITNLLLFLEYSTKEKYTKFLRTIYLLNCIILNNVCKQRIQFDFFLVVKKSNRYKLEWYKNTQTGNYWLTNTIYFTFCKIYVAAIKTAWFIKPFCIELF